MSIFPKENQTPYPILDGIPESDRRLFCAKCLIEQLVEFEPKSYLENEIWWVNVNCKTCGHRVTRFKHTPGHGWWLDVDSSRQSVWDRK